MLLWEALVSLGRDIMAALDMLPLDAPHRLLLCGPQLSLPAHTWLCNFYRLMRIHAIFRSPAQVSLVLHFHVPPRLSACLVCSAKTGGG